MKTKVDLQALGVIDRLVVIISSNKVLCKHGYVNSVQSKVDLLLKKVKSFKDGFKELFKMGLPSFWDGEGKLISQEVYHALLV